jgi:ATP-binding cassette subfamily B protein
MARILSDIQSAKVAAERVLTLLSQDLDGVVENPKDDFEIEGNILFSNVDFSYDEREQVLDDFTLEVKKGEKIALVGETGAGKSTIVNLVCKFYHPTGGDILIDGVNYKEITKEKIQSNLGYVLQTPHLFSGSIMDNIRYGKLEASDEEVMKAASFAQADHFIEELENGYKTNVGEDGSKLSTGEKQLISIARAFLADPKIFVLDEATSSIDVNTESHIQKAIESVLENRTSFIIAHRLSTVKFVDKIILLDEGKIVEIGKHEDLMKKKGRYYNLYMNQFNFA